MKGLFFKRDSVGYEIISEPLLTTIEGGESQIEVVVKSLDDNTINVIELWKIVSVEIDQNNLGMDY